MRLLNLELSEEQTQLRIRIATEKETWERFPWRTIEEHVYLANELKGDYEQAVLYCVTNKIKFVLVEDKVYVYDMIMRSTYQIE